MTTHHVLNLLLDRGPRDHAIQEVGPVEGPDQLDGRFETELRQDVSPDARRCRRGERVKAHRRPALAERRELAVFGPEVVAPLADAMRFVHGDEADRLASDEARETI